MLVTVHFMSIHWFIKESSDPEFINVRICLSIGMMILVQFRMRRKPLYDYLEKVCMYSLEITNYKLFGVQCHK